MRKMRAILSIAMATLLMVSCANNTMTWESVNKDIDKLISNGWVIYMENTNENVLLLEKEYEDSFVNELNKNYDITIISTIGLYDKSVGTCNFYELGSPSDASYIYELFSSRDGNKRKVYMSGNIMIETNSDDAIELLNYSFK